MFNLNLRLFKDEVPELVHWSSSYGGQWDSDWIVIFHPSGNVEVTRYIVGWSCSRQGVPVTAEAKLMGYINTRPWQYTCANSAWCYKTEIRNLFKLE